MITMEACVTYQQRALKIGFKRMQTMVNPENTVLSF